MYILAIETSCDETSVAVVKDGVEVLSNIVATQIEEHRLYGGVVPEIASRRHCESIEAVTREAIEVAKISLSEIEAIAVTHTPGLIGALLVGVNFAKGLAMSLDVPIIPTHHIRSHIAANYIAYPDLKPPFLCLVISGGHTNIIEVLDYTEYKIIGSTRDDAVGEAYDKAGRAMGYQYPAGVEIDKNAQLGDKTAYKLPRPKVDGSEFDMSFSGLKTAVLNLIHNSTQKGVEVNKTDLSASFQATICDILKDRVFKVLEKTGYTKLAVAGGVSANSGIRAMLEQECDNRGVQLFIPPLCYCGDNAAMVGAQAYHEFKQGNIADLTLNAVASTPVE